MLTCRELHAGQQRTLRWSQWRQSGRCQRTRWANESGWLSVRSGPGLSAAWATTKHNEPTTGSQGQSVNPAEKQKSTFSSRLIQLPLTGRDAGSQFRAKLSERKNRRETRALLQTSTITKSSPQTAGSAVSLYNDPFTQRQIRDYLRGFKRLNDSFVLSPLPSDHMKSLMTLSKMVSFGKYSVYTATMIREQFNSWDYESDIMLFKGAVHDHRWRWCNSPWKITCFDATKMAASWWIAASLAVITCLKKQPENINNITEQLHWSAVG